MDRIDYIDNIKAFAILCVVIGHVYVFSLGVENSIINFVQNVFCMPLFFFISGMFAKSIDSLSGLYKNIYRKFFQLIVPFLTCGLLFTYLGTSLPLSTLLVGGESHNGYWFLLVLFELSLIFSTTCYIFNRFNLPTTVQICLYIIICISLRAVSVLGFLPEPLYTYLSFGRVMYNFPYYVLGYFLFSKGKIELLTSDKIYNYALPLFIGSIIVLTKIQLPSVFRLIVGYIAVLSFIPIVFHLFSHTKSNITAISYVGKRTLEIYVLHYFFIPKDLHIVNGILFPSGLMNINLSIELFIVLFIAILTMGCALCGGYIIHKSNILSTLLLGKWNGTKIAKKNE